MHRATLKAVASAGVWSRTGSVLRALRQDGVSLDQRLAVQFVTSFGRLGDIASAEAIFEVCRLTSKPMSRDIAPSVAVAQAFSQMPRLPHRRLLLWMRPTCGP